MSKFAFDQPFKTDKCKHNEKDTQRPYIPYRRKRKKDRKERKNPSSSLKEKTKKSPFTNRDKSKAKCYKCVKIGHYANRCYIKKKINEIENEGLRKSLYKIMIHSDTEIDTDESDAYYSSTSSDEDPICHCNTMIENKSSDYWKVIVEMMDYLLMLLLPINN